MLVGCGSGAANHEADSPSIAGEAGTPADHGEAADETLILRGQTGVRIEGQAITAERSIVVEDCQDITIIDCDLRQVEVSSSSNIRILNCHLHDAAGDAVYFDDCSEVLVQGNRIERVRTGVLVHRSTGVRVIGNYVVDVQGPLPGGQLVQFDKVTGGGNIIAGNVGVNHRDSSNPEDMISIYMSHGTEESPILIEGNDLSADPIHGSAGKSDSGSGIMLGDNGGSWQSAQGNILRSPGQVGIGVASGEHIVVESNYIVGHQSDVSNVGLYVWNQYEDQAAGRVTVTGNTVEWTNAAGDQNPYWDGGGFSFVYLDGNLFSGRDTFGPLELPERPSEPLVPYVEPNE